MTEPARELVNGIKLVGELVLPGASLWVKGEILNGAVHTVLGLGAKALLGAAGPAGLLLVAADSYSKSATDKYLWDHLVDLGRSAKTEVAVAPVETAEAA